MRIKNEDDPSFKNSICGMKIYNSVIISIMQKCLSLLCDVSLWNNNVWLTSISIWCNCLDKKGIPNMPKDLHPWYSVLKGLVKSITQTARVQKSIGFSQVYTITLLPPIEAIEGFDVVRTKISKRSSFLSYIKKSATYQKKKKTSNYFQFFF